MPSEPAPSFVHHVRPRYGEIDLQRVVFNAHYLAYCDDAADLWLRSFGLQPETSPWDVMVKKAVITWSGAARVHDDLAIAVRVSRWGTTSFDVTFEGTVDDRPVFVAELTYVAVRAGTTETVRVPDDFRAVAGGPA
jgi:YbgC/YbaW family acyl-CoA thioester hydrolase